MEKASVFSIRTRHWPPRGPTSIETNPSSPFV